MGQGLTSLIFHYLCHILKLPPKAFHPKTLGLESSQEQVAHMGHTNSALSLLVLFFRMLLVVGVVAIVCSLFPATVLLVNSAEDQQTKCWRHLLPKVQREKTTLTVVVVAGGGGGGGSGSGGSGGGGGVGGGGGGGGGVPNLQASSGLRSGKAKQTKKNRKTKKQENREAEKHKNRKAKQKSSRPGKMKNSHPLIQK